MGVKVTIPNTGSDYLTFGSANTADAAKVGGYEDSTGNGHLELYTTASGTSTERMRIDSAGNVGIGTSSPIAYSGYGNLALNGTNGAFFQLFRNGTDEMEVYVDSTNNNFRGKTAKPMLFYTSDTERMRIDSSGNLLVGCTSAPSASVGGWMLVNAVSRSSRTGTGATDHIIWMNGNGTVGAIGTSGSSTYYYTSSDYRLKENVKPIQNALATVAQLNPVTYTWKADGSDGQGFIAHELQAVVPDCVTGEKDAVDAEGKPVYQGIDTSFLVATLTKAIQEQQAQIETLTAKVAALEAK